MFIIVIVVIILIINNNNKINSAKHISFHIHGHSSVCMGGHCILPLFCSLLESGGLLFYWLCFITIRSLTARSSQRYLRKSISEGSHTFCRSLIGLCTGVKSRHLANFWFQSNLTRFGFQIKQHIGNLKQSLERIWLDYIVPKISSALRTRDSSGTLNNVRWKFVESSITWASHCSILLKFGKLMHYGSAEVAEWLKSASDKTQDGERRPNW